MTDAQLTKWGVDWAAHADELNPDEATRDLGYMANLAGYERWTLPVHVPKRRWVEERITEFAFDAKLRLLRGLRDGKPEQAAAEVRALAKLMLRAESVRAHKQGTWLLGACCGIALNT
jgi:hypothetical protein